MTENFDWSLNQSKLPAATMQDEADDKISTYSKVKNFTSAETNVKDNTAVILNILLDENKSTQKSIAILNRNIHELLVLLNDKKTKDRERRF